jgi:hypothetical protein
MGSKILQEGRDFPASLFVKQRFDIACAVVDMKYLNTFRNRAIKDQVIIKAFDAPRADIFQARVAEFSQPSEAGFVGQIFKSFIRGFDDIGCGIRIIPGDERSDCPKLILNAWRQDEFRHELP